MNFLMDHAISKTEFDHTIYKILQRPEYAHLKNGLKDFIEWLKEIISWWLQELLKRTFSNLSSVPSISEKASTIFLVAGLLVILAIIIFIVVKARNVFERKVGIKEILGERIDDRTTPYSLRNKASNYIKEGDYRLAVRYEFIALLLLLHERNLVYLDETKTNEEILYYLHRTGFPVLPVFQNLAGIFNASWYGYKMCQGETYNKWSYDLNLIWNKVIGNEEKN